MTNQRHSPSLASPFRTATPRLSFRAAGEESPPRAMPRSLALLGMTNQRHSPSLASPFRTATPRLSFRAAGEESPPLAMPRSVALLGMTNQRHSPSLASPFRAATPLLSFRAAGEESPPLAMPRSLAFARDDDGESFQAQGEESAPLATPGSLALLGMTEPVSTRATRTCVVAVSRACVSLNSLGRRAPAALSWLKRRTRHIARQQSHVRASEAFSKGATSDLPRVIRPHPPAGRRRRRAPWSVRDVMRRPDAQWAR
jgi:hypothetical protein